jgi:hypothetical protein
MGGNPQFPQGQQNLHSSYKYIYLLIGLSLDAWIALRHIARETR